MEFSEIHDLLIKINAINDVAESHGIACGLLVANLNANKLLWIKQVMGEWFDQIKQQLHDSHLRFELCLPNDAASLEKRVESLQEWCRGFILGIAMSGVKSLNDLPEDTQELLSDFSRISTEEEFDLENHDETEIAYTDISQYIRIGVLLINEELQPALKTISH